MIPLDFAGTTVLVTGTSGCLGSAIVDRFLEAGADVVAHARRPSPTTDRVHTGPSRFFTALGDLEDQDFVAEMFSSTARYGPIDVLINNAGAYPSGPLLDTSTAAFDQVMRSNGGISFSCLREAAKSMKTHGGGSIVNIGSLSATRPTLNQAAYSSAKAAVASLSRSAANELAPHHIRVNTVSPGLIDRPGLIASWPAGVESWLEHCPMGRLGAPCDVADACLFLASPLASWITGHELIVDGGACAQPAY